MSRAYYNEIDPYAAAWLRNLIAPGHIAPGDVDERNILDVRPSDLVGYTQCHFFAGIGVWSYALRCAGWPDDRPVWTGSCPCQPFSAAGKRGGFADERHLWPAWHHLIRQCAPENVFGEQVASKDGLGWLDLVSADMEGTGYAFWPVDLCAAGVGAPHIRQRLWFTAVGLADASLRWKSGGSRKRRSSERLEYLASDGRIERWAEPSGRGVAGRCSDGGLDHHHHEGLEGQRDGHSSALGYGQRPIRSASTSGELGGLADDGSLRFDARLTGNGGRSASARSERGHVFDRHCTSLRSSPLDDPWRDADWLFCRDGKWRPVESGTFPLAHGAASRVGRLRAYGNAIVAEAASAVIATYLEAEVAGFEPLRTLDLDASRSLTAFADLLG